MTTQELKTFAGMPVVEDASVPPDTIILRDGDGKELGRIVNAAVLAAVEGK